jgi:hypothetical protein
MLMAHGSALSFDLRAGSRVRTWSDHRVLAAVIGLVGVLAVAATAWIYASPLPYTQPGPIRGDGLGYYAYLPATLLDHDLSMRRTGRRSFKNDPALIPGVRVIPGKGGAYLDQYGVGESVLLAPFFAAGYVVAAVSGEPRGGYSWPYEAAVSAASIVYLLLGLGLLASVLKRWFSRRTVVLTLLGLTFGAAVFDYATFEPSMSHVYSFFAIALVMRLTLRVWDRPSLASACALGAALGLVGLIRLTNLAVVLFCVLVGVASRRDAAARVRALLHHPGLVAAGTAVTLLVLLPQAAYWHHLTGQWVTNPYLGNGEHLDLLHPHLAGVLFSVRKGLFFWTPLTILAVVGVATLRRAARPLFLASAVYLPVAIWIVASWSIWWYGVSFGMRALIDVMPVFALGLGALIETMRGLVGRALGAAIVLTTLVAIHGMLAYWLFVIPGDRTDFTIYLRSLHHW